MNIAVIGLWHLGSVTAACLAHAGYDVIGYDPQAETIDLLQSGKAPIFEPGLDHLLAKGVQSGKLHYTSDLRDLAESDIIWITFDTPVDDNDMADIDLVTAQIKAVFPHLQNNVLVLISSQLPVGSTRKLLQYGREHFPQKNITFACSPENLRLGKAIDIFTHPDRMIVGLETEFSHENKDNHAITNDFAMLNHPNGLPELLELQNHQKNVSENANNLNDFSMNAEKISSTKTDKERIIQLLKPFTDNIVWMSIESAEMTKHALNAFLATSVVFINEISTLCERVGANAQEVELGLKSEERIGPKAYLRPGNAIAGGTLARDINYLIDIGKQKSLETPLFSALLKSNHAHKQWSCSRIIDLFNDIKDKTITILGLTYKVGTDTLRRSTAVEMGQWLAAQGAKVKAYDPVIRHLPDHLTHIISLKSTLNEALTHSHATIIATEWPEFAMLSVEQLLTYTEQPYIFDAGGFLQKNLGHDKRIFYFSVGRQS